MIRYIDYRPIGAARELFFRRDPEVGLSGPAGTGKSRGAFEKQHWAANKYPGSRHLCVRKTRASLTTTGIITYRSNVIEGDDSVQLSYQEAKYSNGSVIVFGGMDKSSKIMSGEYDTIFYQEATEGSEGEWEDLTTRLRWGRMPYQQMLFDCNPGPPTHWLKRRSTSGKLVMLESRHEDNPTLWDGQQWTEKGKKYIAILDNLSGARKMRLRHGIWAAAEGMVYDTYDPALHVIDRFEIPQAWPRVWGLDFGYTNPFVWQCWARDPDGRLYMYREIYMTQRLVEDHCRQIKSICKAENEPLPVAIICDHDAEDRATFERHMNLPTRAAYKSISPGIQAVQNRLRKLGDGRPRLMFLRDSLVERDMSLDEIKKPCSTVEEIEGYVWPKSASGLLKDVPVKKDDHGMDDMRYIVAAADGIDYDPGEQEVAMQIMDPYEISSI